MRSLLAGIVLALLGCGATPAAPEITGMTYAPMQLPYNTQSTITGSASFRDAQGDCHLIGLGFINPKGVLSEAAPQETGTSGKLIAGVPFSAMVTPTDKGTYELAVRFVDDTGLSSETRTGPIEVQ